MEKKVNLSIRSILYLCSTICSFTVCHFGTTSVFVYISFMVHCKKESFPYLDCDCVALLYKPEHIIVLD